MALDRYQAILTRRSTSLTGNAPASAYLTTPEFTAGSYESACDWVTAYMVTHELNDDYFFGTLNNLGPY